MTHIYYAYKRDGEIHESTICRTPKLAEQAARVYCVNMVQDATSPKSNKQSNAWHEMLASGRLQLVELYCREIPMEMTK